MRNYTRVSGDHNRIMNKTTIGLTLITLQIIWCAYLLVAPAERGVRFGWQMFSSYKEFPHIMKVELDGTEKQINPNDYLVVLRSDSNFIPYLLEHLKNKHPENHFYIQKPANINE